MNYAKKMQERPTPPYRILLSILLALFSSPLFAAVSAWVTVSPSTVYTGEYATVSWGSSGATNCYYNGNPFPLSGSTQAQNGSPVTVTYTLTCINLNTGEQGSGSATLTIIAPPQPPLVYASVSPSSIYSGQSATLSWSSSNATSCNYGGPNGSLSTGAINSPGTYGWTVTCSGPGGSASAHSGYLTVSNPPQAPTVSFYLSKNPIVQGESVTWHWSSTNADSCTYLGYSDTYPPSGSKLAGPYLTAGSFQHTIRCSGPGGSTDKSLTFVREALYVTLTPVTSTNINLGGSITWHISTNGSSCTDSAGNSVPTSGNFSRTYSAPAYGGGNFSSQVSCHSGPVSATDVASFTIVTPPVISSFSISPNPVYQGQTYTASWSAANASSCSYSGATYAPVDNATVTGGNFLPGNFTHSLSCSGSGGSVSANANLQVLPLNVNLTPLSATNIYSGDSITWHVQTNAPFCVDSQDNPVPVNTNFSRTYTQAGQFTETIRCFYSAGTGKADSVTYSVVSPLPSGSYTGPLSFNLDNEPVLFTADAHDLNGTVTSVQALIKNMNTGVVNAPAAMTHVSGNSYSHSFGELYFDEGVHNYQFWVVVTDNDGNIYDGAQAGNAVEVTVSKPVSQPPTVDLSVSPGSVINLGQSAEISITYQNADHCEFTGAFGTGPYPAPGSPVTVSPASPNEYIYTATCSNAAGSASDSIFLLVEGGSGGGDTSDPDLDGLSTSEEALIGTHHLLADTDEDGMLDGWEVNNGFDPLNALDGDLDSDFDGASNVEEAHAGSDPHSIASCYAFSCAEQLTGGFDEAYKVYIGDFDGEGQSDLYFTRGLPSETGLAGGVGDFVILGPLVDYIEEVDPSNIGVTVSLNVEIVSDLSAEDLAEVRTWNEWTHPTLIFEDFDGDNVKDLFIKNGWLNMNLLVFGPENPGQPPLDFVDVSYWWNREFPRFFDEIDTWISDPVAFDQRLHPTVGMTITDSFQDPNVLWFCSTRAYNEDRNHPPAPYPWDVDWPGGRDLQNWERLKSEFINTCAGFESLYYHTLWVPIDRVVEVAGEHWGRFHPSIRDVIPVLQSVIIDNVLDSNSPEAGILNDILSSVFGGREVLKGSMDRSDVIFDDDIPQEDWPQAKKEKTVIIFDRIGDIILGRGSTICIEILGHSCNESVYDDDYVDSQVIHFPPYQASPEINVGLNISNTELTLLDDYAIQANISGASQISNYKFQIKGKQNQWYDLGNGPSNIYSDYAKVAGTHSIRVIATINGEEYASQEAVMTVNFPAITEIMEEASVIAATEQAWNNVINHAATVMATSTDPACLKSTREEGFWIRVNTQTKQYEFTNTEEGPVRCIDPATGLWYTYIDENGDTKYLGPSVNLGDYIPADSPRNPKPIDTPVYTVASFHTHGASILAESEFTPTGPSEPDLTNETLDRIPLLVRDYISQYRLTHKGIEYEGILGGDIYRPHKLYVGNRERRINPR